MWAQQLQHMHGLQYMGSWVPAAAAAKLLQLCPTLYDPIDGSPPGSPVPGILQARMLEWVAIASSAEETHVLTKQEILLGKSAWAESSRVEPRRTAPPQSWVLW